MWPSQSLGHPEWGWGWSPQVGGCRRALARGTLGLLVCCCEAEEGRRPTQQMGQGICANGKQENGCCLHNMFDKGFVLNGKQENCGCLHNMWDKGFVLMASRTMAAAYTPWKKEQKTRAHENTHFCCYLQAGLATI